MVTVLIVFGPDGVVMKSWLLTAAVVGYLATIIHLRRAHPLSDSRRGRVEELSIASVDPLRPLLNGGLR